MAIATLSGSCALGTLALDDQFVYWVDDGAPVDGGFAPGTASIYRVAKP